MPREFALGDIYFPTLLVIFLLTVVLNWVLSWLLAKLGLTRYVWHQALFHLALFVCLFTTTALFIY
jgi:hypothetical protein